MSSRRRGANRQVIAARARRAICVVPASCRRWKDRSQMPPVSTAEGSSPSLAETASYKIRAMSQRVTVVSPSTR